MKIRLLLTRLLVISLTVGLMSGMAGAQDEPVKAPPGDDLALAGNALVTRNLQNALAAHALMRQHTQQFQGGWLLSWGNVQNVIYTATFAGNTIIAHNVKNGRPVGGGIFELDPINGTIDVLGTSGQFEGKVYRGLYAFEGNKMVWSMGNANQPRPKTIAHQPGSNSYLVILQPRR